MSHWSKMFTEDSLIRHIWSRLPGLLLPNPPLANRKRREVLMNSRSCWWGDFPGPEGEETSPPEKALPTCLLTLVPQTTDPSVVITVHTVGSSHPSFQGWGRGERAWCVRCDKTFPLLLLTFNYLNPCCFILISLWKSLLSSSSRNLCDLNIYKTDPSEKREAFVFYFLLCSNGWDHAQTILKLVCNSLIQLFIIWA